MANKPKLTKFSKPSAGFFAEFNALVEQKGKIPVNTSKASIKIGAK